MTKTHEKKKDRFEKQRERILALINESEKVISDSEIARNDLTLALGGIYLCCILRQGATIH